MAKKKVARKKPGRPKGSANKQVDTLEVDASRCGRCGSTTRTQYTKHRKISISGEQEIFAVMKSEILRKQAETYNLTNSVYNLFEQKL